MTGMTNVPLEKKKGKQWLGYAVKTVVMVLLAFFIYRSIAGNENFEAEFFQAMGALLSWGNAPWIALLFVGIFANWAAEAWKWMLLARKIEEVSFWKAFGGVLSGLTMSFISTTHAGHYLGRVWHLKHEDRYHALGAMVVNSMGQASVAYLFGGISLIYFLFYKGLIAPAYYWPLQVAYIGLGLGYIYVLFRYIRLVKWLRRFPWVYNYLKVMELYTFRESMQILGISALRYSVYFMQFALLLWMLSPSLPALHRMAGVALVFLAKGAIPNFSIFTDLGIREFSGVQFLGSEGFGMPNGSITLATLALWCINLLFPVVIGAYFAMKGRITKAP